MVEPKRKKEKKDDTKKRVKELERIVQKLKGKRSKRKAVRKTREYRRRVSGDEEAPSRTRFERAQEQIEAQNRQIRERRIGEGFAGLEQLQQQRLFGMAGSSELKMRQTEEIFKRNVEAEKELTKQAQEEQKKAQEAEKKAQQEQKKAEDEAERLKKEIERVKRKFVPKDPKQQRRMARKLAERTREQRLPDETDDEYIGRVGAKVVEQSGSEGSLKEAMMESQVSTSSSSGGDDEAQENIQKGLKQREALRPKVEAPPLGDGGVKPALTKKEANTKQEYARIINKVLKGRNGADKLQQATIEYYQEKFGYDPYERGQTAPDAKIVNKDGTISGRWLNQEYRHWSKPYLEGLSSYIQRERVRFLGDAQPVASTSGTKEEEAQPRFQPSMEEFEKTIVPIEEGETQVIPKKPVASTSRDVETQARLPTEQEKKEMELRGKLQMRIVEANSIIGDRERAMERQRQRIEQLESRINTLESLEELTVAQQREVQTLINKLATESAKSEEIMRELEVTRRQRDRLIQERDEMVRLYNTTQQDLETQQRNNKELEDTLELRRKDIIDLQERHRKAEDTLELQAGIFATERASLERQRDKAREKLERANELETKLTERIDTLETQLEQEVSMKSARKKKIRDAINRLLDERNNLQKRIEGLEEDLQKEIGKRERAYDVLQRSSIGGDVPGSVYDALRGEEEQPRRRDIVPPRRLVEQVEQIQSQQSQQQTQEMMMTPRVNDDHIQQGIQQHQQLNRQVEEDEEEELPLEERIRLSREYRDDDDEEEPSLQDILRMARENKR